MHLHLLSAAMYTMVEALVTCSSLKVARMLLSTIGD